MKKNYVMKFDDWGDSVFYRVACNCTEQDCDMTLELERDKEYNALYLNIYKRLRASAHWGYTSKWGGFDFVRVLINKIRMCCRIMFSGYIEVSEAFIMKDEKHIESFREVILDGIQYLKKGEQNEKESGPGNL